MGNQDKELSEAAACQYFHSQTHISWHLGTSFYRFIERIHKSWSLCDKCTWLELVAPPVEWFQNSFTHVVQPRLKKTASLVFTEQNMTIDSLICAAPRSLFCIVVIFNEAFSLCFMCSRGQNLPIVSWLAQRLLTLVWFFSEPRTFEVHQSISLKQKKVTTSFWYVLITVVQQWSTENIGAMRFGV